MKSKKTFKKEEASGNLSAGKVIADKFVELAEEEAGGIKLGACKEVLLSEAKAPQRVRKARLVASLTGTSSKFEQK